MYGLRVLDSRSGLIQSLVFYTYADAMEYLNTNARRRTDVILLLKELKPNEVFGSGEVFDITILRGLRKHKMAV